METRKALLRKADDGRYEEVGVVVARNGKHLTLETQGTEPVRHHLAHGEITPDYGSFFHLFRVSPETVEQVLASAPARIYKQLISESKQAQSPSDLRKRLGDLEPLMPRDLIDSSWEVAKPALDGDEQLDRHGASKSRYKLRRDATVDLIDLLPASSPRPPESEQPDVMVGGVTDSPTTAGTPSASGHAPVPTAAQQVGLTDRLRTLTPGLKLHDVRDALRRPLAVASAVGALTAKERTDLVKNLDHDSLRTLHIVAAHRLRARPGPVVGETDLSGLLSAAASEVEANPDDTDLRAELPALFARVAATTKPSASDTVRLLVLFAAAPNIPAEVDRCLALLSAHLDAGTAQPPSQVWTVQVAAAAASVPFTKDGGRSRFVASLHRRAPDEARKKQWWTRTAAHDLAEASVGRLGAVLDDDEIARSVVAPLVRRELDDAATRRDLATILALPTPVGQHVEGHDVARVMARVAAQDPTMARWRDQLTNADEIRRLEAQVESAASESERLRASERAATVEADRLTSLLMRADAQLNESRQTEAVGQASRDRQLRIDLVRSLAVLAAQVKQSSDARADVPLMRQVDHACRREDLQAFGEPGDEVVYDPEQHEALDPDLAAGSPAAVVRSGFTWADQGSPVTLVKAHVAPV